MIFTNDQKGKVWASTACFHFQPGLIGSGALSKVLAATDKATGVQYAVKVLDLRAIAPEDQRNVERELEAYRYLQHPTIIRYYDHIIEDGMIYIVLELVRGGSLYAYLRSGAQHAQHTVRRFYRQCVEVVEYIHRQGFLVRDIKPENFLLDEQLNVRICDFGWACRASDREACFEVAGTYAYMSPEALLGMGQTAASDVWSLGVLLYEMYYQREPFPGSNVPQMLERVMKHRPDFKTRGVAVPDAAIDLIKSMLKMAPRNRPTLAALAGHRFFGAPRSLADWERQVRAPAARAASMEVRRTPLKLPLPEAESTSRKQSALTAATRSSSSSSSATARPQAKRRVLRLCSPGTGADWLELPADDRP